MAWGARKPPAGWRLRGSHPALRLFWAATEGAGARLWDASGSKRRGLAGTTTAWSVGEHGNRTLVSAGLGSDMVRTADGFYVPTPTAYTWSLKARFHAVPSQSIEEHLLTNGTSSDSGGFAWGHQTPAFRQTAYHGLADSTYVGAQLTDPPAVGEWATLTATWDGATLTLYRDGAAQASVAAASLLPQSGFLCLFRSNRPVAADVEYLRIEARAWGPAEVREHAARPYAGFARPERRPRAPVVSVPSAAPQARTSLLLAGTGARGAALATTGARGAVGADTGRRGVEVASG